MFQIKKWLFANKLLLKKQVQQKHEIQNLLAVFLNKKKIHKVAVPRAKMDCLNEKDLLKDIIPYIIKTGRSRFPVMNEKQEFVGVLFVKDIFSYISKLSKKKVKNLMKPPIKISYTASIQSVLQEMKERKSHIVLMVDEYGSVDGIVTMEDIVEELIGDIEDEFDNTKPEYKKQGSGVIVNSDMPLEEFNKVFGFGLQEERVDTIGGYICFLKDRIPNKKEVVLLEGKKIEVISATQKKLKKLKLYL
jgi:magnesium and cobalt transporter